MADSAATSIRLNTGVPGLDDLLGGGLIRGRSVLLKGSPGSGKTTLGLQALVSGARDHAEPGILLTFEQDIEQIVADASSFGWPLEELAKEKIRVMFIQPKEVMEQPGRNENKLLLRINEWVHQTGGRRILIDSLSHLRPLQSGDQARALLLDFMMQLKNMGLTPFMTAELTTGDVEADLDAYLADVVFHVTSRTGGAGRGLRRELRIVKARGHRHAGGAHPFEIGPGGITVFPHEYPVEAGVNAAAAPSAPAPSGVPGLDALVGGGYRPGSCTLIAGLSGTFKTTVAAHFLTAGAAAGEPGLWITLHERASDIEEAYARIGMDLRADRAAGRIVFLEAVPGIDAPEKVLLQAESIIREKGIRRVAVDSMSDLTAGIDIEEARQETAGWFLRRLRSLGVTTIYTQRLARAPGRNPLSEIEWAELADTIIYLGVVEIESRLERVISVLKSRGASSESDLRGIAYGPKGLVISDKFVGLSGVLSGAASGTRKAQIEKFFQPLYFLRDFLKMAADPALDPARREQVLKNLSARTESLLQTLGEHFGEPVKPEGQAGGGDKAK